MPLKTNRPPVDNAEAGWTQERKNHLREKLKVSKEQLAALVEELGVPVPMPGRSSPKKRDNYSEAAALAKALERAERQVARLVRALDALDLAEASLPKELGSDEEAELPESAQKAILDYHNSPIHDLPSLIVAKEMRASQNPFDELAPEGFGAEDRVDLKALLGVLSLARRKAEMVHTELKNKDQGRFLADPFWVQTVDVALKQGFIWEKSGGKKISIHSEDGFKIFRQHEAKYVHGVSEDQGTDFFQVCDLIIEVLKGAERGGPERAIEKYINLKNAGCGGLFPIPP